jgi:hypothetical protein
MSCAYSNNVIIIGRTVGNIYSLPKLDVENNEYVLIGRHFDCGYDFPDDLIHLTKEIYDWFLKHIYNVDVFLNGDIIEVIKMTDENCSSDFIEIPDDLKNATAYCIEAYHYSSKTIGDLNKNYFSAV